MSNEKAGSVTPGHPNNVDGLSSSTIKPNGVQSASESLAAADAPPPPEREFPAVAVTSPARPEVWVMHSMVRMPARIAVPGDGSGKVLWVWLCERCRRVSAQQDKGWAKERAHLFVGPEPRPRLTWPKSRFVVPCHGDERAIPVVFLQSSLFSPVSISQSGGSSSPEGPQGGGGPGPDMNPNQESEVKL